METRILRLAVVGLLLFIACGGELQMQSATAQTEAELTARVEALEERLADMEFRTPKVETRTIAVADCVDGLLPWPGLEASKIRFFSQQMDHDNGGRMVTGSTWLPPEGGAIYCPDRDAVVQVIME